MKICFITSTIFNLGGIQRVVSVLANEMCKYHDVTVICTNATIKINREMYKLSNKVNIKIEPDILDNNGNIFEILIHKTIRFINKRKRININHKLLLNAYYPKLNRLNLLNKIKEGEYDIVIGVEPEYSIMLGSISKKINNCKLIGWQHNSYEAYLNNPRRYYWGQDELFKKYISKLDACIVLTDRDKELYETCLGIDRCKRIYNPLSFSSEIKSNNTKENIIFVGRLIEYQKGLDILLNVFERLSYKNWTLTIVGDGYDKNKLIRDIKYKNLTDKVKIYNSTDNITKHYVNSSILLSTSRWEGFGLVITEAMECGLSVVAFNNSGPNEIITNNVNGILVDRYDIDEMVKKIELLIEDKELRRKISNGAIKRANDFKVENIMKEWNYELNNLILNSKKQLNI